MATRLYLHDVTNDQSGTYPTGYIADGAANSWTQGLWVGVRKMNTTIGVSATSIVQNTSASTSLSRMGIGMWTSPPLNGAQTVGGGTAIFSCSDAEASLNANIWTNNMHIFVWRPSTGAVVGHVKNMSTALNGYGGLEPTAATTNQVSHLTGLTTSAISAQNGDVVCIVPGSVFQQSMGTAYSITFIYDGTVTSTTENAAITDYASYIELAENLTFQGAATFIPIDPMGMMGFFGI